MQISVIFPAYNEQASIRSTIERALQGLRQLFDSFEIIIVDDKSTDTTGQIADQLAAEHPEVRVFHNPRNLRAGASIVAGFKQARGELVTHNAMDYPFHLEDLRQVLPLLEKADVVAVARNRRPESSLYRRFLTAVNLGLLRNFFGLRLKDYNFVQVYKRAVLQQLDLGCTSTGFLTPSLMFQAHRRGYRVAEITLDYWPRETGAAASGRPKVLIETLKDMARFWWSVHRRKG